MADYRNKKPKNMNNMMHTVSTPRFLNKKSNKVLSRRCTPLVQYRGSLRYFLISITSNPLTNLHE